MYQGSIVALVTPMKTDGAPDLKRLGSLLDYHLTRGSDGIVVAGTTGEAPTLTAKEIVELVREASEVVGGHVPVIAGCGSAATSTSVAMARRVCAAGADGCLAVTPYYNRPTQEGLYRHFTAIADAATRPVMLYNVPSRTACDLLPVTVARLAAHPNIVAIKEASADLRRVVEIRELCGEDFAVLSGDDATAVESMVAGATGVVSVTANVAPQAMHEACAAMLAGREAEAREIDARLAPLHAALFLETSPIPVKWAAQRMGLIGAGLRLPLTELSEQHHATLETAMRTAGLL